MNSDRHAVRLGTFLVAASVVSFAACCNDRDSSRKIQPARTFAAPTKSEARGHRMSRPYGCGGNPYYYDHDARQWVYYDSDGNVHVSPNQPPCAGAERVVSKPEPTAFPPQ